jgi:hypothetical protein
MENQGGEEYSSYSFLTLALDGVSGQWQIPAALYPRGKTPDVNWIVGWASKLFWTKRLKEKLFASAGDRTPVVQNVVRHYSD